MSACSWLRGTEAFFPWQGRVVPSTRRHGRFIAALDRACIGFTACITGQRPVLAHPPIYHLAGAT